MPDFSYNFLAPPRIAFGWRRRHEAGALAQTLGTRAFLVTGSRTLESQGTLAEISESLRQAGVEPVPVASISREPLVEDVDGAVAVLRRLGAGGGDLVLAVGGGSAIDLAKAAAALVTNTPGDSVQDYLEGVGKGLQLDSAPLPLLAMPTTSGTGSEATKNAVVSSYAPPFKKSLRSDQMLPRIVLIDPELSISVPPQVTAWTGMDAITQLIESYICRKRKPLPQALALQGLELAVPAIGEAVRDGASRTAREHMAHAALLSGMALANSGLGLAHGVAAALGVHCRVPHGLACAVMLPAAMRVNRPVCEAEFARLAEPLTGKTWASRTAAADAAVARILDLNAELGIPQRLSQVGVLYAQLGELVPSSRGNSMSGNPRELSDPELRDLLEELF